MIWSDGMFRFNYDLKYKEMLFRIKANPGIYTFGNRSGLGKTYVYRAFLFESISNNQSKVFAYTFDDYQRKLMLTKEIVNSYDIIMLDRFDLYYDAYHDLIIELSKSKTVLLDFKNIPRGYFQSQIGRVLVIQMPNEVRVAA